MCTFARMKQYYQLLAFGAFAVMAAGCAHKCGTEADRRLAEIETLFADGRYQTVLDSISSLRRRCPEAVEQRRQALKIWQEASLKLTQADIARTDSALQAVTRQMEAATTIRERNFIGVKRDSLQVRYEALCGTVRVIHRRQSEK